MGVAFLALMVCPVIYLLFEIPSFFAKPEIYFLSFIPYITLSMSLFYMVLGTRHYKVKDLLLGQLLGALAFTVYIQAIFSALLGIKIKFGITNKGKNSAMSYWHLWPQLTLLILNFIALVWGLNRFLYERDLALVINGTWALYHLFLLSSIFYFNEEDSQKIECRSLSKKAHFDYRIVEKGPMDDLGKETWQNCFSVALPEQLDCGTLVMGKVIAPNKEAVVFDGKVVWVSKKRGRVGFKTVLAVVTDSAQVKEKVQEVLSR